MPHLKKTSFTSFHYSTNFINRCYCKSILNNFFFVPTHFRKTLLLLIRIKSIIYIFERCFFFSIHSNERLFLRDFVSCVASSSGSRLAQWLQPSSRVDPSKCQVLYSREELRCGWPAIITVLTRDQYSDLVNVANMKVSTTINHCSTRQIHKYSRWR
jgi:hypothetical protein